MTESTLTHPLTSTGRFISLRLMPGDEVLETLQAFVHDHGYPAVAIVSSVGSLTHASIRYANQPGATDLTGHFEIVSLIGTLENTAPEETPGLGGGHVHLSISDGTGAMIGGHMMPGCRVYTTLEIVLLVLDDVVYTREPCTKSGYPELTITSAPKTNIQ